MIALSNPRPFSGFIGSAVFFIVNSPVGLDISSVSSTLWSPLPALGSLVPDWNNRNLYEIKNSVKTDRKLSEQTSDIRTLFVPIFMHNLLWLLNFQSPKRGLYLFGKSRFSHLPKFRGFFLELRFPFRNWPLRSCPL